MPDQPQPIPPEIIRNIERAEGFLALKMSGRASKELKIVSDILGEEHDLMLNLRLQVFFIEEKWSEAAKLARLMVAHEQDNPGNWIQWAFASRRSEGITSAERILMNAAREFPKEALIHYNLACYAAVEDHPERARELLSHALEISPEFIEMAREDDDLISMQDFLNTLEID